MQARVDGFRAKHRCTAAVYTVIALIFTCLAAAFYKLKPLASSFVGFAMLCFFIAAAFMHIAGRSYDVISGEIYSELVAEEKVHQERREILGEKV